MRGKSDIEGWFMKQTKIMLEDAITYQNYFNELKECNKSVNYKYSVQEYDAECVSYITKTIQSILAGNIPYVKTMKPITIVERGKKRTITPIDISDRITQKVLCDKVLIPSISPHLIYDNGASVKGKGTEFARKRINTFLEKAKREYGWDNVYALVFDFKSYFDSISHEQCYRILKKYIYDERLVNLTIGIIESYKLQSIKNIENPIHREKALQKLNNHEGVGICLGSQISQIMAISVPNDFDHYIKDVLHLKYYERYMDDGVILFNDKKKLLEYKNLLSAYAKGIGLQFNEKKTYIVKATKGFTFLKIKYHIDPKGKTVKQLVRSGIVRERRKLKKFEAKVAEGKMSLDDVYNNIQSWNAHSKIAKAYHTTKTMFDLYDKKFGGYKITRKYFKEHPEEKRKRKVVRL